MNRKFILILLSVVAAIALLVRRVLMRKMSMFNRHCGGADKRDCP